MKQSIIILGAGGHAKVLIDILKKDSYEIIGITDPNFDTIQSPFLGIPIIGDDSVVFNFPPTKIKLVNGLGSVYKLDARKKLYEKFKLYGYNFISVVHQSSVVSEEVVLLEGAQIMAGVIIQPGTIIGKNSIINTKVSVDHDCQIGDHVHIAPGTTLSGDIKVEDEVHIGTGATIIQGITVGNGSLVGAGAVVTKNVQAFKKVLGVPAKEVPQW